MPKDLQIHLILDNYATHKHEEVRAWLGKPPRFHLHFTPTSSSWLNLVERWFRELSDKALRRGVFHFVPDLVASPQALCVDRHRRIHPRQGRPRSYRPRKSQPNTGHTTSEASPLTTESGVWCIGLVAVTLG